MDQYRILTVKIRITENLGANFTEFTIHYLHEDIGSYGDFFNIALKFMSSFFPLLASAIQERLMNAFSITLVELSYVNARGKTKPGFTIEFTVNEPGVIAVHPGESEAGAFAMNINFIGPVPPGLEGVFSPMRNSNIKLGPISSRYINSNGALHPIFSTGDAEVDELTGLLSSEFPDPDTGEVFPAIRFNYNKERRSTDGSSGLIPEYATMMKVSDSFVRQKAALMGRRFRRV